MVTNQVGILYLTYPAGGIYFICRERDISAFFQFQASNLVFFR